LLADWCKKVVFYSYAGIDIIVEVKPSDITEAVRQACNMVRLSVSAEGGDNGERRASARREDLAFVLDFIKESIVKFESARLEGYTIDQQCSEMMRILQLLSPLRSLKRGIEASLEADGKKGKTAALIKLLRDAENIKGLECKRIASAERPETGSSPRPSCPGRMSPEEVLRRRHAMRQKA
jgi:hypothetical protein